MEFSRNQNSSLEAFIVVLVSCKNEKDPINNTGSRVLTRFPPPHYKYGNFFKRSRAANSTGCGQIGRKFELIQDYIVVLVTCKNEEAPIKNQSTRELTSLLLDFFRHSRVAYSEVGRGISPKFKFVQACMIVLITCKNKKDPIKNEGSRVLTRFSPIISLWKFFQTLKGS